MSTKKYSRLVCIEYQLNDKSKLKRLSVAQVIELGTVIEDTLFLTPYSEDSVERIVPLHEAMALNLTKESDDE